MFQFCVFYGLLSSFVFFVVEDIAPFFNTCLAKLITLFQLFKKKSDKLVLL